MDRRSSGRAKNVTGGSGSVYRRGSGLGSGQVGNGGSPFGRFGGGSSGSSDRGYYGGGRPGGYGGAPGGYRGGGGRGGCLSRILPVLALLFIFILFSRGCSSGYEETYEPETYVPESTFQQTADTPVTETSAGSTASFPSNNNGSLNENVDSSARIKYTDVQNAKSATVLVYICGSNLESENGMATSDLQEMISAGLTEEDTVRTLVYTGGASRWKNNVVSSQVNQIYRVVGNGLERVVADDGDKAMTDPATLTGFINYGVTNYPADRYILILWDHGAGSVMGYGHDEKHTSKGQMSLSMIQEALRNAGAHFDFVGYDACLMATLSDGFMLSQFADYMIASEETEPGTGWYYTNWLKLLKQDPSVSTLKLGKQIADDYTSYSAQYQRGSSTTLSVTDLAELSATVPEALESFSVTTNDLLNSDSYKTVSDARADTKEFAATDGLDQVDLAHLALNVGTEEGRKLAQALIGAVKYNRTTTGYEHAYGLSEYFPYRSEENVDDATETYTDLGYSGGYTDCIRTFANMQLSGQIASGGSGGSYSSLFESLFGGNGYGYTGYDDYSGYGVYGGENYNGYYGGYGGADSYYGNGYNSYGNMDVGTVLELMEIFAGRSCISGITSGNRSFVNTEKMKEFSSYVAAHSVNPEHLKWKDKNGTKVLSFTDEDWDNTEEVLLSVFVDDGEGYIDLGLDNVYTFDSDGDLVGESDGTWLSLNGHIVSYYFIDEEETEEGTVIRGYIPALVNEKRSEIGVTFDAAHPYGTVTGYRNVYVGDEAGKGDKSLAFKEGDVIEPVADYYSYPSGENKVAEFIDAYRIGEAFTYEGKLELANIRVEGTLSEAYRLTDIYGQHFWTEAIGK